jgi:hypothetical protein
VRGEEMGAERPPRARVSATAVVFMKRMGMTSYLRPRARPVGECPMDNPVSMLMTVE